MPYVRPEVKERIKREVSIQRLAEARGIKLIRSGKELIGLCPFHDDRNPSLNIDPAKNVWSCKGACGEGGDVILWVMRAEGVSFHHALELLKRDHFSLAAGPIQPIKTSTVRKLPPLIDATADDKKLLGILGDHLKTGHFRTSVLEMQQHDGHGSRQRQSLFVAPTEQAFAEPIAYCAKYVPRNRRLEDDRGKVQRDRQTTSETPHLPR
jgi:hypothetical protein